MITRYISRILVSLLMPVLAFPNRTGIMHQDDQYVSENRSGAPVWRPHLPCRIAEASILSMIPLSWPPALSSALQSLHRIGGTQSRCLGFIHSSSHLFTACVRNMDRHSYDIIAHVKNVKHKTCSVAIGCDEFVRDVAKSIQTRHDRIVTANLITTGPGMQRTNWIESEKTAWCMCCSHWRYIIHKTPFRIIFCGKRWGHQLGEFASNISVPKACLEIRSARHSYEPLAN